MPESRAPTRRALLRVAALTPLAGAATGCGVSTVLGERPTVRVAVSWSAGELAAFRSVLAGLNHLPGFGPMTYDVTPVPFGDDIGTAPAARGAGRLDLVMLPLPGELRRHLDTLAPIPTDLWPGSPTRSAGSAGSAGSPGPADRYAPVWRSLLFAADPRASGPHAERPRPYALPFKMSNKSAVWYDRDLFRRLHLRPPSTWAQWLRLNQTLRSAGIRPLALGVADGWSLTDFFENVLLGTSPSTYERLAGDPAHRPALWGSAPVRTSLRRLADLWGPAGTLAGGVTGSLVRQFPESVLEVFAYRRAAMVVVADYAEPYVRRFTAGERASVGVFRFPRMSPGVPAPLVAGGDVMVLTRPAGPEAVDLLRRLAHPLAPRPWIASTGGFIAADHDTPLTSYSPQSAALANELRTGAFHFDLSDQLGAVGSREGMWRALKDFLADVAPEPDGGAGRTVEAAIGRFVTRMRLAEERERASAGNGTGTGDGNDGGTGGDGPGSPSRDTGVVTGGG
ncbi:alpha-glucoside transport system substrate-binding protein [Actinopolymorpha cephalotaxi]|uniref:Alpha-glucoside transport system substrate-binding protein n=1 Tax=Actinopolymorpha cephalotaxi TaxID=504797 RepID=A0A1I2QPR3_9ACTN|nr:ABC transporter substrate-binding protein [Actinopolymorpha cephalotaxi]NYH82580.1 alpha-glucoside transport system substrate-binding protein [Actinopolymorpha cephalotaxi]SFG29279.1 alpha-glucoside transport system substrate-binding protein [Actinopolymorpha cephalotaxi]